jgi:hypothetical protein
VRARACGAAALGQTWEWVRWRVTVPLAAVTLKVGMSGQVSPDGYVDEYPVGNYLRDAPVTTLYQGTSPGAEADHRPRPEGADKRSPRVGAAIRPRWRISAGRRT